MDAREAHRRAQEALQAGNSAAAQQAVWALLGRSHMSEDELRSALALAEDIYRRAGLKRAANAFRCGARVNCVCLQGADL